MASITSTVFTYQGRTAANLRSLFCGQKFLKLLIRLMVGQVVPEILLSVGSKLELLRAYVFATFPYTSPYTHAFVRVCINYCPCIRVYTVYMIEAPRVLHFSAFIIVRTKFHVQPYGM